MNVNSVRNNCENQIHIDESITDFVNQPERLSHLIKFAITNNKWRASKRELLEKLVVNFINEKKYTLLTTKGEEIRWALSEIKVKLLEDDLNQIDSIDKYLAFAKKNQGQIKTMDLGKFSHNMQYHQIQCLIESCPNLETLHLISWRCLESLDVGGLKNLKELNARHSRMKEIRGLKGCLSLRKLDLRFCEFLKNLDVSGLHNLEILDLRDSSIEEITGLSGCPNLKKLYLSSSQHLKTLDVSHLKNLKILDLKASPIERMIGLSDCLSLKELYLNSSQYLKTLNISGLRCLEKLDLSDSSIEEVGELSDCKNLHTLSLSYCQLIKSLNVNGLICLEKLDLSDSSIEKLTGLNSCSNLKMLDASTCQLLKRLDVSSLRKLEELYLTHSSIEELIGLGTLTSLREIKIDYCSHLVSLDLSDLHQLERVYSSHCPLLRSLGETLSNCRRLECEECPQLISLPQVPLTATVMTDLIEQITFSVDPEELEEKPLQVLLKLGTHLLANQPMPNIVWLDPRTREPQEGVDVGGLKRQLVTTLSNNLFNKQKKERPCFPFTKELEGQFFLNPLTDQESIVALRTFARLIALCFHSSLLLGAELPAPFFYALGALSDEEIDAIPFNQSLDTKLKEAIYRKIYSALLGIDSLSEEDEKEMNRSSILFSLAIVAKELKQALGTLSALRNNTEAFISRVQGKLVTKESLFECLQFTNDINNQIQHYFKTYFNKLETGKLKDLLELFTACRTLGCHPITITVFSNRETGDLPTIHTCCQEVEMPAYTSYEQFEEKIEKSFYAMGTFLVA